MTGVGRGGVASAVTAYNETMPDYTLAYFENVALQALADWGVPVGAAALLGVSALVVRLLASVRRERDSI